MSAYPDSPYINVQNFPLNLRNSGYSISLQIKTFRTFNVHNFPLNLRSFGFSIYLQIQTIHTLKVHNFLPNLRNSGFSIYLQIQTFRTNNIYNFPLNLHRSGCSISLEIQTIRTFIMYTISRWILEILDIQFLRKTRHSVHLIYIISLWIYVVLNFQFTCKSRQPYIYCTQFTMEFTQFWILNYFVNLDIPYIYNLHKFALNLRNFGYSIFTKTRHSVHLMYTFSFWIYVVLDFQFIYKSRHSAHI